MIARDAKFKSRMLRGHIAAILTVRPFSEMFQSVAKRAGLSSLSSSPQVFLPCITPAAVLLVEGMPSHDGVASGLWIGSIAGALQVMVCFMTSAVVHHVWI